MIAFLSNKVKTNHLSVLESPKVKSYKLFILALFFLNIYIWVNNAEIRYGIPSVIKYLFAFPALLLIIYNKIANPVGLNNRSFLYPFIVFFLIWSVILLITAVLDIKDLFYIQRVFADPYFFLPYVIPLFIIFTKFNLDFFRFYYRYATILIILGLLTQIITLLLGLSRVFWGEQLARILIFDLGSSFLLLSIHVF